MIDSELYQNELTVLGHGLPIWEPNPDCDCVRIGDVGYLLYDQFITVFNILSQNDYSNQDRGIEFPQPTANDFPSLHLPATSRTTQQGRNPLHAGVYARESSLTFSAEARFNR